MFFILKKSPFRPVKEDRKGSFKNFYYLIIYTTASSPKSAISAIEALSIVGNNK
jgi:hypothetical protein